VKKLSPILKTPRQRWGDAYKQFSIKTGLGDIFFRQRSRGRSQEDIKRPIRGSEKNSTEESKIKIFYHQTSGDPIGKKPLCGHLCQTTRIGGIKFQRPILGLKVHQRAPASEGGWPRAAAKRKLNGRANRGRMKRLLTSPAIPDHACP